MGALLGPYCFFIQTPQKRPPESRYKPLSLCPEYPGQPKIYLKTYFYLTMHEKIDYFKSMTSRRIVFLQRFSKFITRAFEELGTELLIFWLNRTEDQQAALYAIGRTIELHRKPVTNCNGIDAISKHQIWEAGDVVIVKDGELIWDRIPAYEELGRLAKEEGLRWGGDWDGDEIRDPNDFDPYHFELRRD